MKHKIIISPPDSYVQDIKSPRTNNSPNRSNRTNGFNPSINNPPQEISNDDSESIADQSFFTITKKASDGISTLPNLFILCLPFFCFSKTLRFLVTSPP